MSSDCEGQTLLQATASESAEHSSKDLAGPSCRMRALIPFMMLAALLLVVLLRRDKLFIGSASSSIEKFSQGGYSWGKSDIKFTLLESSTKNRCCKHLAGECCLDDNLVCWDDPQDAMPPCCPESITTHGLKLFRDVEDLDAVEGFFRDRIAAGVSVKILPSPSGSLEIQWVRGQLWFGLWNSTCHGYNWYDWISPDQFLHQRSQPYSTEYIWMGNEPSLFLQFKTPFGSSYFHDCLVGPVFENCGKVQPCYSTTTTTTPDCRISFYDPNVVRRHKDWCCSHKHLACPPDCRRTSFWDNAAPQQQKDWCCAYQQVACAPDCRISFWTQGIAQQTKDWCCSNQHVACAPNCNMSFYDASASQQEKRWCCSNKHVACAPGCDITFWDTNVSQQQKDFCCSQHNVACTPDCDDGYSTWLTSWSENKKEWCCAHSSRGCPIITFPFDCSAGEPSSWTGAKRSWCCTNRKLGCDQHAVETKSCKLWGDPHVITFDGAQFVFYRTGDFWIIKKGKELLIQGQFENTQWTKQNDLTDFSSMTALVLTGSVVGGHKIEVRAFDHGGIYCDGKTILQAFGTASCGGQTIAYSDQGNLIDAAMNILPHRVVMIHLPGHVTVQVNRFPNFMNALITMSSSPDLDGICGNYNGDADDEVGKLMHRRFGAGVPTSELLFDTGVPLYLPTARPNLKKCSLEKQKLAAKVCAVELDSYPSWTMAECIGDLCVEGVPDSPLNK